MVSEPKKKAVILGLGLDDPEGQTRITRGKNFRLYGGSQETHDSMQEKCIKFNEKLDSRGKELEQLEKDEFLDIAEECKMKPILPEEKD